jgi:hypothetical protein
MRGASVWQVQAGLTAREIVGPTHLCGEMREEAIRLKENGSKR